MAKNKEKDFAQLEKSEKPEGHNSDHWIANIFSLDGSEAALYENYIKTKSSHLKEIEKRRTRKVSEEPAAKPAKAIDKNQLTEMGQEIQDEAEKTIAKAFNQKGLKCRVIKR